MANTKISDLTASASNLASTDLAPVVQTAGVGPVKMTGLQLAGGLLGSATFNGATVTTSQPVLNLSQTWNGNSSTLFYGAKINIATTPGTTSSFSAPFFAVQVNGNNAMVVGATSGSNGGYAFLDLRVNSSDPSYSTASIADNGTTMGIGNGRANLSLAPSSLIYVSAGATSFRLATQTSFGWSTSPSDTASDLQLTRAAAATLQLGAADAAAPVAQTFKVQSVVGSTPGATDVAGANFTIQGSAGRGSGAGGSIIFQVAPAGSAGTGAQNAYSTALTIASNRAATFASDVTSGNDLLSARWVRDTSASYLLRGEGIITNSGGYFAFASGSNVIGNSPDVLLYRDAANTLALRNGTNAQLFRVYSTYNGTNDAYGAIGAAVNLDGTAGDANTLYIGSQKKGSPTALTKLAIQVNGTTYLDYNITVGNEWVTSSKIRASSFQTTSGDFLCASAAYIYWGSRAQMKSPADKVLVVEDSNANATIIQTKQFTVTNLPAPTSYAGAMAFVSDATATTPRSTVLGGGSNKVMVMSDGTNWLIVA